jgi:glycosyltransferase involved in cell wall biosynthesis
MKLSVIVASLLLSSCVHNEYLYDGMIKDDYVRFEIIKEMKPGKFKDLPGRVKEKEYVPFYNLMTIVKKACKTLFTEGPLPFLKKTVNFFKRRFFGIVPVNINPGVYNFIGDYSRPFIDKKKLDKRFRAINKDEAGASSDEQRKMVINWVIPDMGVGSGGHMTIFGTIGFLEKFGHKNRIYVFGGTKHGSSKKLKKFINDNFFNLEAEIFSSLDNMKDSDAVVATSWQTAYPVRAIQNTRNKFYFVQDFEPWFYPMSSEYKMAENTYKFGFYGICAGPWLVDKVKEYGMNADYFDLAYNPKIYFPKESKGAIELISKDEFNSVKKIKLPDATKPKIVAYVRPVTPRRCFELLMQSLRELYALGIDFDLSFVGWDLTSYIIPFDEEFRNLRILTHTGLADLYSWADLGIVFSPTNYSLLPQEMMACKLPVLEMKSETTEKIFKDGENITLADPDPISIADKIEELLDNP